MIHNKFTKIALTALLTSTIHYSAYASTSDDSFLSPGPTNYKITDRGIEFRGQVFPIDSTPIREELAEAVKNCLYTAKAEKKGAEVAEKLNGPQLLKSVVQQSATTRFLADKDIDVARTLKALNAAVSKQESDNLIEQLEDEIDQLTTNFSSLQESLTSLYKKQS